MEELLAAWGVDVLARFDAAVRAHPSAATTHSSVPSERTSGRATALTADMEYVVYWFQKEVNILICKQLGARYWSHFDWVASSSVEEEGFDDRLSSSLITANKELVVAKRAVLQHYEAIFAFPLTELRFSQVDVQRRIVRALHHLETLWHLVVLPTPQINLGQSMGTSAKSGIWKKFVFRFLERQFDLLHVDSTPEDDEPQEEPTVSGEFSDFVTQLSELSLLDACSDVLQALLQDKIEHHINAKHAGEFTSDDQLKQAQEWTEKNCLSFIARVLCPDVSIDELRDKLHAATSESDRDDLLRASRDSDMDDHFELLKDLKRITSHQHQMPSLGYPVKDPTSSVKKPYVKKVYIGDDGAETDSADFARAQLSFDSPTRSAKDRDIPILPREPSSVSNSPLRRGSPPRLPGTASPNYRGYVSPIPLGSAESAVANFMKAESIMTITTEAVRLREVHRWKGQLHGFLVENFAKLRISEIWNLIMEYPDSLPALKDLKACLDETEQVNEFVQTLRATFHRRLLHPGATTSDIVATYISTIRAMREIDPSSVLLAHVTIDLKQYLRNRADSLRAIVSLLTEDGGETGLSLVSELQDSANQQADGNEDIDSDTEDDDAWMPAPIILAPSLGNAASRMFSNASSRSKDMISALIAIHGNKENFIAEYAHLMATRLLDLPDFATENEVKNVELLKLRFGEASMLQCEVMLKDMADSKRINTSIGRKFKEYLDGTSTETESPLFKLGEQLPAPEEMSTIIFSHMFWPSTFQPLTVVLPEPFQTYREEYEKAYKALKDSRLLQWYDWMGSVELELEFEPPEGTDEPICKEFKVNPLQASIIMQFQETEELPLVTLTTRCKTLNDDVTKRGLSVWLSNGVLHEISPGVYRIADRIDSTETVEDTEQMEEGDLVESKAEEYGPYIVAMLKNLGALALSRIHQMLTNVNEDYDLTIQQLSELLECMVKEEKIESKAGVFSLKK